MNTVVSFPSFMTDDEAALKRQSLVDEIHQSMGDAQSFAMICSTLLQALNLRVWEGQRILAGGSRCQPVTFIEFVTRKYPVGLGTTVPALKKMVSASIEHSEMNAEKYGPEEAERVKQNIRANLAKVLMQIDAETQRGAGGANNPNRDPETGRLLPNPDYLNVDNVHVEATPRPTGNSKDAGLRRLRTAAEDKVDPDTGEVTPGDARAKDCLDRVLAGEMSVNAAHIEMGWRPKMVSVRAEDAEEIKRLRSASLLDSEVKKDAARMLAARLAERFPSDEWDWLKSTLYTAGAKAIADALASEIGAGVAPMDKAGWQ